jgi:methanogenic corrinoid protein MtbC1
MKMACDLGHSIREIAQLGEAELIEIVHNLTSDDLERSQTEGKQVEDLDRLTSAYVRAIEHFRVDHSERIISRAAALLTPNDFCLKVVLPCLREIGEKWHNKEITPAHEHLASSQLRGILHRMIPATGERLYGKQVMFATPSEHLHEFGILVAACITAQYGHKICYLGTDLPVVDAVKAVGATAPDLFVSSIVGAPSTTGLEAAEEFVQQVGQRVPIWVGMPATHPQWGRFEQANYFQDFDNFSTAVQRWAV